MLDDSFSGEFVDDGARGRTFGDVDVLSVFGVCYRFVEVGVGPGCESAYCQHTNHDYQKYQPLHSFLFWSAAAALQKVLKVRFVSDFGLSSRNL